MAMSPEQIVGQTPVLCRFVKPDYDSGTLGRMVDLVKNVASGESFFDALGNMGNYAGLLGPVSSAYKLEPVSSAPIDIKQNFMWTSSKGDPARLEMPYVFLKEKIVDRSSRLQNALYSTVSLLQSPVGNVIGAYNGADIGASIGGAIGGLTPIPGGQLAGRVVGGIAGAFGGSQITDYIGNLAEKLGGEGYENNLKAYSGLYSTTPTGFSYKLPFVKTSGSISKTVSQSWQDSTTLGEGVDEMSDTLKRLAGSTSSGVLGVAGAGVTAVKDIAEGIDYANKLTSGLTQSLFAGGYSESAKTFSYGNNLPSFEISFYLFNNISWTETVKNWYAVFALQYQNLPNRLNRLIVTPSVIYEAMVPGYFYSMYTYIKNIDVTFLGSNLLIDMPVSEVDNSSDEERQASSNKAPANTSYVNVIVPEVYKVSLSFESLVPETQNLVIESTFQTRANGTVNKINTPTIQDQVRTNPTEGVGSGASQGANLGNIRLGF